MGDKVETRMGAELGPTMTAIGHFGGVTKLGYGCAGLPRLEDDASSTRLVRYALDHGISYVDSSAYYGLGESERRLGLALRGVRDDVFVATKGGRFGHREFDFSVDRLRRAVETSLRRLQTDRIDLYQLHDIEFGSRTAIDDALGLLFTLRDEGVIGAVGVTGYPAHLLNEIMRGPGVDAVLSYCRGHLLDKSLETSILPVARASEIAVINGGPLCMGLLSGQEAPTWHPAPFATKEAATRLATELSAIGENIADVALRYALTLPVASTLLGTTRTAGVDEAIDAMGRPLPQEVLMIVDRSRSGAPLPPWKSGLGENEEPGSVAGTPQDGAV